MTVQPGRLLSETERYQERASFPHASAWVSANAGSGKTTVLVRRVLRLLLAGIEPSRILCLTYTTAAAANMANRLFNTLSLWANLSDAALEEALEKVLGERPDATARKLARQLFAYALETPGGLKIETIHAFCVRILQNAPFEAGVPAHFEVISDTDRRLAFEEAIREVLRSASNQPDGLKASLDLIAAWADDTSFRGVIDTALKFGAFLADLSGTIRPVDAIARDIRAALGIADGVEAAEICRELMERCERTLRFEDLCAAVAAKVKEDKAAEYARALSQWPTFCHEKRFRALCVFVLKKTDGQPNSKHGVTEALKVLKDGRTRFAELQQICAEGAGVLRGLSGAERTIALFSLARLIAARYQDHKRRLGALDFSDLTERARAMLESGAAAWVLYKLDSGLDHLLVDEAQDTSAEQWAILNALTAEFHAGEGQRAASVRRTVFAVGDEKQSIFGFQGAAPAEFVRQRDRYRTLDPKLSPIRLNTSFRSTRDVIEAVDAVFAQPAVFAGLTHDPSETRTVHVTNRTKDDDCGAVDVWDLVEADPDSKDPVWHRPLDAVERQAPVQRLAKAIARTIRQWMEDGRDDLGRAFQPGDALVLMPKRKAAFEAVVRALKEEGVPVAGMDRIALASHVAIEDMSAIARAALLPEDDLTLACALKTPIFGLDDEALIELRRERDPALRESLRAMDAAWARDAEARLAKLEDLATHCGPFAFFSHLLSRMEGRRRMIARLGQEAGDALDALLQRALEFERREGPCLTSFLEAVAASSDDVRRDLSEAKGEVRVMTIHGAKGLEAKTVFIADIGAPPDGGKLGKIMPARFQAADGREVTAPIWVPRKEEHCPRSLEARNALLDAAQAEHRRLLYVAMTRAENRLIVCGVKPGMPGRLKGSWYEAIAAGLEGSSVGLRPIEPGFDGIGRRRFKVTKPLDGCEELPARAVLPPETPLPAWLMRPATAEAAPQSPVAPSEALPAEARAAPEPGVRSAALARGRFVHTLLQWLPSAAAAVRREAGLRLGRRFASGLPPEERERLVDQTLSTLADPAVAPLFGPDGLAEAELCGTLATRAGDRPVLGRVDRLLIAPDRILFCDFKTTARPPVSAAHIDEATLGQLAVYRHLLARLHGGRPVVALAVFTAGPVVLAPTEDQLDEALARITGL